MLDRLRRISKIQFGDAVIAILVFVSSVSAIADTSVSVLKQRAQDETQKQVIRQSESYQRFYRMCSTSGDLSRLVYLYESAKQTVNVGLLNGSEVSRMLQAKSGLSGLLAYDLSQDGLFLATADCGMTQDQRDYFVMSLITLDLSGKLLGAGGVVGIYRTSSAIMEFIRARSVFAYHAISASGFIYGAFQIYRQLLPQSIRAYKQEHPQVLDEKSVLEHFDIENIKKETALIKASVVAALDHEIHEIDLRLPAASPEVQDRLRQRRADLESKKRALSEGH